MLIKTMRNKAPTPGAIDGKKKAIRYVLMLVGLILVIFLGLPDIILYSKTGPLRWLPFVIIFFGIPFLLFKILSAFKLRIEIVLTFSLGSVLLIGPLFGFWTGHLSEKDLDENGQVIPGVVSEKWYALKHRSTEGEWLYKARFKVENVFHSTYTEVDEDNSKKFGDTVLVKYSKRNPENNRILEKK